MSSFLLSHFLNFSLDNIRFTCKSPPSAYYIMIQRAFVSWSNRDALKVMTFGIWIEANNLTSFNALSFSLLHNLFKDMVFMANNWESYFFLTNLTVPKEPDPNYLTISKSLNFRLIEEWC